MALYLESWLVKTHTVLLYCLTCMYMIVHMYVRTHIHVCVLLLCDYYDPQGGYDSGTPDKVPDLIQFSPTDPLSLKKTSLPTKQVTGQQRNRTKSTDSFNMDPQVIKFLQHIGPINIHIRMLTLVDSEYPLYLEQYSNICGGPICCRI